MKRTDRHKLLKPGLFVAALLIVIIIIYPSKQEVSDLKALSVCDQGSAVSNTHKILASYYLKDYEQNCHDAITKNLATTSTVITQNADIQTNYLIELEKLYEEIDQGIKNTEVDLIVNKFHNSTDVVALSSKVNDQLIQDKEYCESTDDFAKCVCTNISSIDEIFNSLSDNAKIKNLLVPAFSFGQMKAMDETYYDFGGYVLIDSLDYASKADMSKDLIKLIDNTSIKPFIGLDAEGGVVQRLPWMYIKPLKEYKDLSDEEFCAEVENQAKELASIGFNWTLAPVVDISVNSKNWIYSRIIDSSTEKTSNIATRYMQCMKGQGIYATAKHYPGHGGTAENSHFTIPVINKSYEEWSNYDNKPYEALIDEDIQFIMTGHLKYPQINSETATLSKYWMQDELRTKQEYEGLIVTDDIVMLQPRNSGECAKLLAQAINNGADLVIFVNYYTCDKEEIVNEIVNNSLISKQVLEDRINRVLKVKKKLLCNADDKV